MQQARASPLPESGWKCLGGKRPQRGSRGGESTKGTCTPGPPHGESDVSINRAVDRSFLHLDLQQYI